MPFPDRLIQVMPLFIFQVSPALSPDDPAWGDVPPTAELLVRAPSAEEARRLAAQVAPAVAERAQLYRVTEVNYGDAFRMAGPKGVIATLPISRRRRG